MESLPKEMTCGTCGGPLDSGPFGLRCARCVLSMVGDPENGEISYVAELFPELHLEAQVAQGGFGAVYRAEHRRMRRTVALKFLDSVLARNPEAVALFEQEMISVGGLDHPGIVRAHDAGERDGHWYIIMEFVDGMDCGALVRKHGHLPVAESCEIIRQAAVALGHAHGQGLVHRDVKPGNVMVSKGTEETKGTQGTEELTTVPSVLNVALVPSSVKILDFGLAGLAVAPVFSQPVTTGGSTLFLGTLEYISPEQIESPDKVDARADLYSLGATLWRLLTGKTPHGGALPEMSLFVAMKRITSEPVPSLATLRPDLPKPLLQLCDALLSLDREKRPASAAEVARLLEPWCAGAELPRLFTDGPLEEKPFVFPKKNRRPLWAAAAAVVAAAGIGVAAFLAGNRERAPVPAEQGVLEGRAVFSDAVARYHAIPPQNMPRLVSTEWEVERERLSTDTLRKLDMARLRPDGRLMWIDRGDSLIIEPGLDGKWEEVKQPEGLNKFGVQPETGNVVWTRTKNPDDLVIHRILQDGTKLVPLGPDFSKEASAEARAAMKVKRQAKGDEDGCTNPFGMAFVTENTVPPGSGLRPGDVLYADEGHRDLALYHRPMFLKVETFPGLWKFRFDSDAPAQRLGSLHPMWVKDGTNFPLDVTVSRHGVFLLNRTNFLPSGEVIPADSNARVFRWDTSGLHPCTTDQPIHSPAGIAADPLSPDLYVLDGGSIVQPGVMEQRILRLRPAGPDRYTVETFARKFRGFSYCGLQITPDGQRMVITDERLSSVVVLRRMRLPEPTFRPLFSSSLMASRRLDAATAPRLLGEGWEPESEAPVTYLAEGGRLLPDRRVAYRTSEPNGTVNIMALTPGRSNAGVLVETKLYCFGVAPDSGCLIWDQRGDSSYRHLGRARPNGSRLESLTFDPSGDFDGSQREAMRAFRHRYAEEDQERRPCGFAFVTEEQIPENTGLRVGDVLIADEGHRWLAPLKPFKPKDKHGLSGLWRCRFDDDEPAQRLGENEALLEWALDVTVARSGVFMLNRAAPVPTAPVSEADRTRRLLRWDLDGFHPCTLSEPVYDPSGIAADPLSTDLYIIEGAAVPSGNPILQRLLRLRRTGPDAYAVEPLADRFGRLGLYGVQVTADGQRLVITDSGNRVIVVLKRQGATAPATNHEVPKPEDILGIPGWKVTSNLTHNSPFTSPQFAPGGLVLYCSKSRLRIVAETGGIAETFMDEASAETPTYSGVSPLTGHVAWTQTKDSQQPGIGRATTDGTKLAPLKFTDPTPPLPGSFAFVTEANLPPGTPLRPGDALVAGSRHPDHPESTSGLWRFRFDNDEPPARLVQVDDATVNAVTLSKAGVFLLTGSSLQRWDGTALHPVTTNQPLQSPLALAADPLSSDLFLLEKNRLLRLRPGSADTFTVEVLTTEITGAAAAGLCFSGDGKRLLVGDYGRKKTWVLERKE